MRPRPVRVLGSTHDLLTFVSHVGTIALMTTPTTTEPDRARILRMQRRNAYRRARQTWGRDEARRFVIDFVF